MSAVWFQLQGLKVVMIDWDLEAPGLESFFGDAAEPASLRSRLGLLDLLRSWRRIKFLQHEFLIGDYQYYRQNDRDQNSTRIQKI